MTLAIRPVPVPLLQALTWRPDGLRATDLAARARMTNQSMGSLVDALEANGYVERAPDPSDSLAKVVRLTSIGWAVVRVVRVVREEMRRVEAEWAVRIGAERVEQIRTIPRDLVDCYAT